MSDDLLDAAFADLDDPAVVHHGPQIRALVQRRRRVRRTVWLAAAAVAVAGAAATIGLIATRGPENTLGDGRWRGESVGVPALQAGYVIEGVDALDGTSTRAVRAGERVIFTVHTSREGYLCLDEEVDGQWQRVFPADGASWWVDAGRHWPGGDAPMAFVTDEAPGKRAYQVRLDTERADCSSPVTAVELEVDWR